MRLGGQAVGGGKQALCHAERAGAVGKALPAFDAVKNRTEKAKFHARIVCAPT